MNSVEKLALLRAEMKKRHLDAYVVVTDDFHTSEYVGAHFKAREFLSGFTGSAGTLVVLPDAAALWTDGRYFLQALQQLEGSGIELMRMGQPGVPEIPAFLRDHVPENGWIGLAHDQQRLRPFDRRKDAREAHPLCGRRGPCRPCVGGPPRALV